MIKKRPFTRYNLDKERDTFTVGMDEVFTREAFDKWKYLLQQGKDSTAIKQLAIIGAEYLQRPENKRILEAVLNNYRRNKRLGIVTFD